MTDLRRLAEAATPGDRSLNTISLSTVRLTAEGVLGRHVSDKMGDYCEAGCLDWSGGLYWPCDAYRAAQAVLALLDRMARLTRALELVEMTLTVDSAGPLPHQWEDALDIASVALDRDRTAAREALAEEDVG